jgi:hypothetical protein
MEVDMRKLWIAILAALGLSFWPVSYAHADWEDVQDAMDDLDEEIEDARDDGHFVRVYEPRTRVYIDEPRRVERVYIEDRPVVRHYRRTVFIED